MKNKKNNISGTSFRRRRIQRTIVTVAVLAVIGLIIYAQNQKLIHSAYSTGYLLIGAVFFLAAFNLRKKLTFLPAIGSASTWMQIHIYVGLSTFVIFGMHIAWRVPDGWLEGFLATLYLTVALSGVYGLYATRVLPKKLTALSEEIIYERIPAFRKQVAVTARQLVIEACESSDVLAKFYVNRLAPYFEKPRSLAYMVHPSSRQCRQLVAEIEDLDRYLAKEQRSVSRQLTGLVRQKDDLDYHSAIQGRLKIWLFMHIGLTYSLLIVAVVHGVMAHAFGGGLR